jgi:hypothetical protein
LFVEKVRDIVGLYLIFGQTGFLQLSQWARDPQLAPRFDKLFAEQWPIFTGGMSFAEAREDLARARGQFSSEVHEPTL